jgi:hypothetical protein
MAEIRLSVLPQPLEKRVHCDNGQENWVHFTAEPDWRQIAAPRTRPARKRTGRAFPRHPFATRRSRLARLSNANRSAQPLTWVTMPTAKVRATAILGEFEQAHTELVGKAVILTDGKAGTVDRVWLDETHGLRISIRGHDGKWPVSTIKLAQAR